VFEDIVKKESKFPVPEESLDFPELSRSSNLAKRPQKFATTFDWMERHKSVDS
jgi:hypothetical protein